LGGLAGTNSGTISNCFSTGQVTGGSLWFGGLVGGNGGGTISDCFWDVNTSDLDTSAGGIGKTTEQMHTKSTFTDAGWDFLGESENGIADIWRLCSEGLDYPKLTCQFLSGDFICPDGVDLLDLGVLTDNWLLPVLSADLGPDGFVDFYDFAIFANAWQSSQGSPNWNPACDIAPTGGDGFVGIDDLAVFITGWLGESATAGDIEPAPAGDKIVNFLDFATFAENSKVSAKLKAYQLARPSSDKSNTGGWTTTPLYAKIDEVLRNDVDYILSPPLPPDVDKICEVCLSPVMDPGDYTGNENHILSYAFRTAIGGAPTSGPRKLVVSLYQDGISGRIAGWPDNKPLTETEWTQRDRYIPPEKASLITDYSKLYVRIKAVGLSSSSENVGVSWVQLQVPPAKKNVATAPSGLSATVISDKRIDLSWTDNSSNEDGFFIERKLTTGGTWERLYPVTGPNVESYSARVAPSTNYSFRVCAYNTGGDSSYTSTATGTSQSHTPTSYYVSITGDDNDAGTIGAPFATVQKGVDMLSAGDTLYIRGGTYQEEVKLTCLTGTAANPITITNYNNETVTLNGTEEITSSWDVHSGNIYKTTLTKDIWQLFVDGKMMTPARWPNANNPMAANSNHWKPSQTWADMDESRAQADHMYHAGSPSLAGTGKSFQGGMAILNTGGWKTYAKIINSHTAGSNNFTHDPGAVFGRGLSHACYYIECDMDCLDTAEEWFYDPNTKVLYLYAAGGVDPDTLNNIRGKTQNYAMELDYCEYLTIEGLEFYGNTLRSDEGRQLTIDGCTFSYPSFRPTMLGIPSNEKDEDEYYPVPHYEGQTVIRNTSGALTQNVVKNCTFECTDGCGLDMDKGKEDVIENNYFEYIDFSGLGQTSIMLQNNPDSVLRRNTIHTTSASETIRLGLRSLAEYNHVWYTGNLQSDGGIFQFRWENQNGSIVRYNWAHDTIKIGVRFDGPKDSSSNINGNPHHNVAMNCGNQGIQMKGDEHKVYCNTAINAAGTDIELRSMWTGENQNSITRNNVCGTLSVVGTHDHNWSGGDETAQMRDPANFDFRPTATSA
ncbi:MAG: fibronectin type III domain-containing protein, partial [Planctomycetota bacterium]